MTTNASFAEVAALAGDPARAGMLHALLDGRALTASELARVAGIAPQTASGHLSRLTRAGLIAVHKQGRHRYHRLASAAVAQMMEGIMQVAALANPTRARMFIGPRDMALRQARTCYDHLAGRLGVALADAMVAAGHVELADDAGLLTESGIALLKHAGLDVERISMTNGRRSKRVLCRPCIDWSERRPHLAGALGAALCAHCLAKGWIRRIDGTRAVAITRKGEQGLRDVFGVTLGS
jgi:DNA-binding transcriptional ArsR family regulator